MLKPYPSFRTQFPNHHHLLSSNPIIPKLNHSHPLSLSPLCATTTTNNNHPIWRRPFSSRSPNILHLASILALHLKVLPEPFNFFAAEIARGAWSPNLPELSILRKKKTGSKRRKTKLALPLAAFALICFAGFWSWRISELEMFARVFVSGLVGVSLIRLSLGKKSVKEWVLGFSVGVFLMLSWGFGKEDLKFWVQRLRVSSPASKFVIRRNRNRFWRISK